jgi:hypothetical protein
MAPARVATTPGPEECVASSFEGRLLEVARSYESYGLLEEDIRLTTADCTFQPTQYMHGVTWPEHQAKVSSSPESSPHGKKLYFLFVKEPRPREGDKTGSTKQPVGQVVVKEAWVPEEVTGLKKLVGTQSIRRKLKVRRVDGWVERELDFNFYAWQGDRLYHAARKAGLFVLFKTDPGTPHTDEGWVYGTVTADGKRVTSAGRVESCMGCHQHAPHDRLFEAVGRE